MSVPAREVERAPASRPAPKRRPEPTPRPDPKRPAAPARTTAARPRTATPPQRHRRARRGLHPTFLVFASTLLVLLIVGVVALNALFAQTAFAVHATQRRVADLRGRQGVLASEAARLSSPERIAEWAARYRLVAPDDVVILRAPARRSGLAP